MVCLVSLSGMQSPGNPIFDQFPLRRLDILKDKSEVSVSHPRDDALDVGLEDMDASTVLTTTGNDSIVSDELVHLSG